MAQIPLMSANTPDSVAAAIRTSPPQTKGAKPRHQALVEYSFMPTLKELGLGSKDVVAIACRTIAAQDGVADIQSIYKAIADRLRVEELPENVLAPIRNYININYKGDGYIAKHNPTSPGWRLTKKGERFVSQLNRSESAAGGRPNPENADLSEHTASTSDEPKMLTNDLAVIADRLAKAGMMVDLRLLRRYHLSLNVRKFVILCGNSGTGKTWLAEEYAKAIGAVMLLVAVAPSWNSNEDLLGFHNPLTDRYQDTEFSNFVRSAAKESELAKKDKRPARPFHVILDEMNLARLEHYFANFLSAMEVRARSGRALLSVGNGDHLLLTDNLYIVGTVNVDETTHGFADKVYDRAQVIEVQANRTEVAKKVEGLVHADLLLNLWDIFAETSPISFRVIDDIISYVRDSGSLGVGWSEALDEQVLQRILPKIRGSSHRLSDTLQNFIGLAEGSLPMSRAKAQKMLDGFTATGFASFI